jgi:ketosteroid isomerase-like protein
MTNNQAVADATDNFYAALNLLFTGDAQAMKEAWDHADDISYMGPEGLYLIGWEKIEQMWVNTAAMKLGGRVTPVQLHKVVGTDMAVINCIESGENQVAGNTEIVSIRSSTVFQKRGGLWKIIGHQTDLLKFLH